ncbi:hypothetical protein LBMAG25_17690 [Bacteroidota bacterium]|nr:hypothetical protein LBMAG25_17690 [Bacteroidota bacterium]
MCNINLLTIKVGTVCLPLFFILFSLNVSFAQTRFNKIYNIIKSTEGYDFYLAITNLNVQGNNFFVVGAVPDSTTISNSEVNAFLLIDSIGNIQEKKILLTGNEMLRHAIAPKTLLTLNHKYYMLGYNSDYTTDSIYPYLLIYDTISNQTVEYNLNNINFSFMPELSQNLYCYNGKIYAAVSAIENGSSQRIHCYIIDTSGNLQSIFNYYTSGYNEILPKLINHTSNKLLLFSSITKQVASLALISRIIARRIDSLGNFIDYFYQGSFADSLYGIEDVIATKDGGFLIATQRYTYSPSFDYQFSYGVFLKLDSAGQKQWIYNPGGYRCNSCDWSYNTIELPCGDFMLSGTFTLYGVPFDTTIPPELNQPARFWHLSRITNQGELVWRRLYNYIKPNNYAYYNYYNFDLDTCPDKGFILSGYISDDINVLDSGWLVKVDSMGCLLPGCHLSPPEVPTDSSVHVLLYPNPANDFINFMPQFFESDVEYRLVDMLGRSVVHGTVPDGSTNMIDSRFLPAGTYLLCVNNDKVRITKKVVVQR